MSAAENTTANPVIEVTRDDETVPTTLNVDNAPVTATTEAPSAAKVTPVQRLNSVFGKTKQTLTDAVSDAKKAWNEKKTSDTAAPATNTATTSDPTATIQEDATDKVGGPNSRFKDILNRVKGVKPTSTHLAKPVAPAEQTIGEAPVPPAKNNNVNESSTATNTNPVFDRLKRSTNLLSNYFLQKKKSSDNEQQQTATPELHDETAAAAADEPATNTSTLVRRITQLVNSATATIYKKREPKKAQEEATTAATTETPAVTA